ncbi:MAG: hypothetical protein WD851_16975 [Pirellulales bacterium]
MHDRDLQSPRHGSARTILRVGGPLLLALGLLLVAIGLASFFASMGSFEPPRYFWCGFVGMPLLFVGAVMTMFGYFGAFQRYIAGESAPVAKDVVNYMGEHTQPGVRAFTKAATEGVLDAHEEQRNR